MRYLTWKLNWDDPSHGTGPEAQIQAQGAHAEASTFAAPSIEHGTILGYLTQGEINLSQLSAWLVQELTQDAALEFAQAIAPDAYFLPDGIITVPMPEPA